jgi:cardiolipin synthase
LLLSQIPNLLTLMRIAACPVLVVLLHEGNYELALILFVAAGITDGLDGYIAKRFNCQSSLGAILDPVADKLLIGSAYIMLAILGDIPFWLLILVMFRDLVIVVGYLILVMMGNEVPMSPSYSSKVNTVIQISLMVSVLLEKSGLDYIAPISGLLVFGVLVTTIISGVQYVWVWGIRQQFNDQKKS